LREFYPEIGDELRAEIARYKVLLSGLPAEAGDKYPAELSGGMKSAQASPGRCRSTRSFSFDEPTAGLDPSVRPRSTNSFSTFSKRWG
jgi:phospholipid/cholesterol/gamma-HCH transport system ATP-binding protein